MIPRSAHASLAAANLTHGALAPAGERGRISLSIGLLHIDSQSALHVVVCAVLGAVALALGIVSPELRLRRGFGAGAPGQRGSCRGQEQDAEHTRHSVDLSWRLARLHGRS